VNFYKTLLSDISKFSRIIEILKSRNLRIKGSFRFSFKEFLSIYKLIKELVERIKELLSELEREATIDRLTLLYNRNFLEKVIGRFVALHERTRKPMSVAMLDIDDFKVINDTYGHRRGDEVLRKIGEIIRESVRRSDLPFRYGGEEFLIIFPETEKAQAVVVCERLRQKVSQESFGLKERITVSIGVASMPEDTKTYVDVEKLINLSDERLYKAKRLGKNKVIYEG
jgi:diguanylate cyclase (GGDEF)-like protein